MKRWITPEYDQAVADRLTATGRLPPAFARIMARRGFDDAGEITRFCGPRLADLSDPFELDGVSTGAERLLRACTTGERVCVFGDYDVDGITSTALLTRILNRLGAHALPFIPSRMEEGYGMSREAVERALEETTPSLLVTVDCGVRAVESVDFIQSRGIDVIVTDHHDASGELARPHALVNPRINAGGTPYANLAGVGVAFKLCHGLVKLARQRTLPEGALDLQEYLYLVALGTVCDVVPLMGENRILARHGIRRMRQCEDAGILALTGVARVNRDELGSYHLGFQLGPRLNAAGRLAEAMASLQLLLTNDPDEAGLLAEQLEAHNRERQAIEAAMFEEASNRIRQTFDPKRDYFLVVAGQDWHPGVVGIVASRLVQRFRRPTVVIAVDAEGSGRGSGRSIEGFNLLDCLGTGADLLDRYGGHAVAAGLAIRETRIADFTTRMNEEATRLLTGADLRPILKIEDWLTLDQLDMGLFDWIESLNPFGMANPRPVLAARQVHVSSKQLVGKNHTRLRVDGQGITCNGIFFGVKPEEIPEGLCDVAFTLQHNTFRGQNTLELQVQDISAC